MSRPLDGDMAAVAVMAALLLLALMAEVGGDSDTPGDMFPRYQPLLLKCDTWYRYQVGNVVLCKKAADLMVCTLCSAPKIACKLGRRR